MKNKIAVLLRGLPIYFKNDRLSFNKAITSLPVRQRKTKEVRKYLKDKDANIRLSNIYLIYRDVRFKKDREIFRKNHLRYDITIIYPGFLGREFPKTIGHFHLKNNPEIYEVLSGKALFLFQEISGKRNYLIKAAKGQKVIVPPEFGHITINLGAKPLVIANIFADNVGSDYDFFKKHHGDAYYITKPENRNLRRAAGFFNIEKNKSYKKIGKLKIGTPEEIPRLGIYFKKPLYDSFVKNPGNFEFLTNPKKFIEKLSPNNLFKF